MSTAIHLHTLRTNHSDLEQILYKIISLSNTIFDADPDSKYASVDLWKSRLLNPLSVITYFTAEAGDEPIAFAFVHPREFPHPLQGGENDSLHIWLAGVHEDFRRRRCLDRMVDEVMRTAKGKLLTLWTTPTRFTEIWQWTKSRGWKVEHEQGEKVLLSLKLGPEADI